MIRLIIILIVIVAGIVFEKRRFQKDTLTATNVWMVELTVIKGGLPVILFFVFFMFAKLFAFTPASTTIVKTVVSMVIAVMLLALVVFLYRFFKQPDALVFADENLFLYRGKTSVQYDLGKLTRIETVKRKETVVTLYNSCGKEVIILCVDDYGNPDELLEHLRQIPEKED